MNKYKKITVLITICYFMNFIFNATGESLIIPKKKPLISTEKKAISELKSEILPLKKPKLEEKKTTEIKKKEIQDLLVRFSNAVKRGLFNCEIATGLFELKEKKVRLLEKQYQLMEYLHIYYL